MKAFLHLLRGAWSVAAVVCFAVPLDAAAQMAMAAQMVAAGSGVAPPPAVAAAGVPVTEAAAATALPGCVAPCAAVADGVLADIRGGFDDGQGLRASFGIERITQVSGQTEIRTSVQIPDLSRITASQAESLRSALSAVTLVQSGPGNTAPTPNVGGTVIQNTLSNQVIRNTTVLDVTTNSLQLLRSLNVQSTLRDALTLPIGGR